MQPKISIITACYNSEQHIEHAIRSVANQTYPNIEYIIVDGGSQDRTLELVNKYKEHVSIVISEPDHGIYDAFNKGVAASTGNIIYFLGSDDYVNDSNVMKDVAEVFADQEALLVYGNVVLLESEEYPPRRVGRVYTVDDFKQGLMPHHAGVFARRELFDEVGRFNTSYKIAGDFEFVLRCFIYKPAAMRYIPRNINVFREGGVSTNLKTKRRCLAETFAIVHKHFGIDLSPRITELIISEYYKKWISVSVLRDIGITSHLKEKGVRTVAIFGTLHLSTLLIRDLNNQDVLVTILIDNDPERQGQQVAGIHIESPEWLIRHPQEYDAIVIAIESDSDQIVKRQLEQLLESKVKLIVTWKELIEKCC